MNSKMLDDYMRGLDVAGPFVSGVIRTLEMWQSKGIVRVDQLVDRFAEFAEFAEFDEAQRARAVEVLGVLGDQQAVPFLIEVFERDAAFRGEALSALSSLGGSRVYDYAVAAVEQRVALDDVGDGRVLILLCSMGLEQGRWFSDPRGVIALVSNALNDLRWPSMARGFAASGLAGALLDVDPAHDMMRTVRDALLLALEDDDAYVRHEATYAVGALSMRDAVERLRVLVKSDDGAGGWGSVRRSAEAALHHIEHGDWPDWWYQTSE